MFGFRLVLIVSLTFIGSTAYALPYSSMDPRTLAMGGAGAASGSSANAVFMNPALLAAARDDDVFSLELPIFGARFNDPDSLVDELDRYQDGGLEKGLNTAVNLFLINRSSANAREVGRAADAVSEQLLKFSNKPLQGELFSGIVVGIPNKKIGASLAVNVWAVGGGIVNVSQADQDLIEAIASDANTGDPNDLLNNQAIADQDLLNFDQPGGEAVTDKLSSNLEMRGAVIQELAVALSREVSVYGHRFALGLTPKLVKVKTFDYQLGLDNAEIGVEEGANDQSGVNLDMGIAKNYGNGWRAGFVIKNLIGQEYETVRGNKIKIDPQMRVGIAHSTDWATMAIDMDLTENEAAGFESKTQYISIGAELDAFDTVQLRVGYRHNMSDSETNIPTIGFGFSPFGAHLDVAIAGNGSEVAGSAQLGFRF